ncbi:hypothetical protein U0070_021202, partial [Myodes glareolus]
INLFFETMTNSTLVTEFLLEVFAETYELRLLLSVLFLLVYLGSLLGNLTIVIATTVDQTLNTPMYFFLRNLSILDMCYVSVTIPNACVNSITDHRNISMTGCAAQIFLVFFCACVEILFLAVMAQDRYVAICKPLLYPVIMNHQCSKAPHNFMNNSCSTLRVNATKDPGISMHPTKDKANDEDSGESQHQCAGAEPALAASGIPHRVAVLQRVPHLGKLCASSPFGFLWPHSSASAGRISLPLLPWGTEVVPKTFSSPIYFCPTLNQLTPYQEMVPPTLRAPLYTVKTAPSDMPELWFLIYSNSSRAGKYSKLIPCQLGIKISRLSLVEKMISPSISGLTDDVWGNAMACNIKEKLIQLLSLKDYYKRFLEMDKWPLQAYALDLEEQVSQITLKIDKSQPSLRGFVSSSVLGMAMETEKFERFSLYQVDFAVRQHKEHIPRGNPGLPKTPENDVSVNALPV